ncbi:monovalent cation:proton antiporter-2 (CPA2) family protein [Bradyrhizobium sp. IAR9]|uniref:monovalent cation:proton antiporter-2 (CPA2) family protein n=1 Tax=Bradyrhizobium sp. IAR9 TaxID=2663841 RepID=UPI0015CC58C3|nr:monovalent cation:proton antiporter-2 (CPA2) family protein [Bradyrhizobium sp. IAR9]NYG44821.1 monovalent cation:proton antiporter-2 (CPA2) family protein [Bradyrhizobium sp. IAR9]
MNSHSAQVGLVGLPLILLAAAVISVPIARLGRLSAIVAYLLAGVVIGPYGLKVFDDPEHILPVAELGVVMLLFLVGLELEFSRLLAMRRDILGLGLAQLSLTTAAIWALTLLTGLFDWRGALVAALALALSATAIALRILEERGHLQHTYGQRAFAILLLQDMSVVPLLALVPLLASPGASSAKLTLADTVGSVALIGGAIAALILAGRYLLNPFFRLLAGTGAREVMTAAALLVVLGAALLMQVVGMSMALGAFLAGVLLAGSNYRHQLEADIEPFRGLLLALFFMGVGMTIDMTVVWAHLWLIIAGALAVTLVKAAVVWGLFRITCTQPSDALRAGSVLTGAGEFAFVLLPLGASLGIFSAEQGSLLSAIAAITLLVAPPFAALTEALLRRLGTRRDRHPADSFDEAKGSVLVIGFGRFGQIVSQYLLAEGIDVTIIDADPEMIRVAGTFGFKVYYGDGSRLDVLHAAGLGKARLIAICTEKEHPTNRIVELTLAEFPGTKVFARSFDRGHTLQLLAKGVDYELRETFESAMRFGREALVAIGIDADRAAIVEDFLRARDRDRLAVQQAEGIYGGLDLLRTRPTPAPLSVVQSDARALNVEAVELIAGERAGKG